MKKKSMLIIIATIATLLCIVGIVCVVNKDLIEDSIENGSAQVLNESTEAISSDGTEEITGLDDSLYVSEEEELALEELFADENEADEDNYGIQTLATHTLAVDSSYVTPVKPGTEAHIDYYFSFAWTKNTSVKFWQTNDSTSYSGKVLHGSTSTTYWIMPSSNSLSGSIGCWVYNVGTYEGETIDVKCTFMWNSKSVDGVNCRPAIGLIGRPSTGKWGFAFINRSFEVKYEIYSNGSSKAVDMSLTIGDIDDLQFFGFYTTSNINEIQCLSNSTVYFKKQDGYYWAYADNIGNIGSSYYYTSIRYELDNVKTFNVVFGYKQDPDSYNLETFNSENDSTIKGHTETLIDIFSETEDGGSFSHTWRMGVF